MADIITRSGKGSALTHGEMDANWKLNTYLNKTGAYTVLQADNRKVIVYTGTGGHAISLPDCSGLTADTGDFTITVKHAGTGVLTVDLTDATDSLDGTVNGTITLGAGDSTTIIWDADSTGAGAYYSVAEPNNIKLAGSGVLAPHNNLKIVNGTTAADQVTLTADELVATNGTNFIKVSSITITDADITNPASGGGTSGYANGHSRPANGWSYMWVVTDGTNHYLLYDDPVSDPANTAPDRTGFSGYYWAFVGAKYTTGGGAFRKERQINDFVGGEIMGPVDSTALNTGTFDTIDLSPYVPLTATKVKFRMSLDNFTGSAGTFAFEVDSEAPGTNPPSSDRTCTNIIQGYVQNSSSMSGNGDALLSTAQTLKAAVSASSTTGHVYPCGWWY